MAKRIIDTKQARALAELLIDDLKNRGGLGRMWFALPQHQQEDMIAKYTRIIREYCNTHLGEKHD